MLDTTRDVPVVIGPSSLSARIFPMTATDWGMTAVALALWFAVAAHKGTYAGFLVLATGIYLLWPLDWGKRYYQWGEAIGGQWIKHVKHDTLWGEEPIHDEVTGAMPRALSSCRRSLNNIIAISHPFPYRVDDLHGYGVVHTSRGMTDSIVISGGGSSITSLDPDRQMAVLEQLELELRKLAAESKISARMSLMFRRRPEGVDDFDVMIDEIFHPDIVVPDALISLLKALKTEPAVTVEKLYERGTITRKQLRDYRLYLINMGEARQDVADNGMRTDMVAIITVRRSQRLRQAGKSKNPRFVEEQELRSENIIQLGRSMQDTMRHLGVGLTEIMSVPACRAFLRRAWDVVDLDKYSSQQDEVESAAVQSYHPQLGIYVPNGNVLVCDRTGHAFLRLTKLPRHLMASTLSQNITGSPSPWIGQTLAAQTVSGQREYYSLNFLSSLFDTILDLFSGVRIGTKTVRRRERLAAQEERVADEGHIEYFNTFIPITHQDPRELEALVSETMRVIKANGGEAQRVCGRARLARIGFTALTGIPLV
ncbi:MAG: hypothetical protein WAT17_00260 [Candidatus Saccharimonadales bacterium]